MTVQIYIDHVCHWRWRALEATGRVIVYGAESYDSPASARAALEIVRAGFGAALVVDQVGTEPRREGQQP